MSDATNSIVLAERLMRAALVLSALPSDTYAESEPCSEAAAAMDDLRRENSRLRCQVIIAHSNFVAAWEALPGGFYTKDAVQNWLISTMKPAVDLARARLSEIDTDRVGTDRTGKLNREYIGRQIARIEEVSPAAASWVRSLTEAGASWDEVRAEFWKLSALAGWSAEGSGD